MASEKTIKNTEGNNVGYELEAVILECTDYGPTIEVRPVRNPSSSIKIENFEESFENRPHGLGNWEVGQKLRVIIVPINMDVSIKTPS